MDVVSKKSKKIDIIGSQAKEIAQTILPSTIPVSITLVNDHSVQGYHQHLSPIDHLVQEYVKSKYEGLNKFTPKAPK